MIRNLILAGLTAASLAAPAAAFARDWDHRGGYDRRWDRHDDRRWRDHDRRDRRDWRERERFRRAYPSYGYYAPRYAPSRCWRETVYGRYGYEVVTRCR